MHHLATLLTMGDGAVLVRLPALTVMIQLGVRRPLGQRLLEPVQQAAIGQGGPGIRPG